MEYFYNEKNIVLICLMILFIIVIISTILIINMFLNNQIQYINSLGSTSQSQLKSSSNRLQRYNLIKNLQVMKKYIGISILIVVIMITTISSIIIFDSRQYFKEYFNTQREKLNLRSEKSVDSLIVVIKTQQKQLDSIQVLNISNLKIDSVKNSTYSDTKKTINNLQLIITQQSQRIKLLETQIPK